MESFFTLSPEFQNVPQRYTQYNMLQASCTNKYSIIWVYILAINTSLIPYIFSVFYAKYSTKYPQIKVHKYHVPSQLCFCLACVFLQACFRLLLSVNVKFQPLHWRPSWNISLYTIFDLTRSIQNIIKNKIKWTESLTIFKRNKGNGSLDNFKKDETKRARSPFINAVSFYV